MEAATWNAYADATAEHRKKSGCTLGTFDQVSLAAIYKAAVLKVFNCFDCRF